MKRITESKTTNETDKNSKAKDRKAGPMQPEPTLIANIEQIIELAIELKLDQTFYAKAQPLSGIRRRTHVVNAFSSVDFRSIHRKKLRQPDPDRRLFPIDPLPDGTYPCHDDRNQRAGPTTTHPSYQTE